MCCDRDALRRWLIRALWTVAILTVVVLLSGCVWGVLVLADDATGAAGAQGVFLVAVTMWALTFGGIVVITALCQIVDAGDSTSER